MCPKRTKFVSTTVLMVNLLDIFSSRISIRDKCPMVNLLDIVYRCLMLPFTINTQLTLGGNQAITTLQPLLIGIRAETHSYQGSDL